MIKHVWEKLISARSKYKFSSEFKVIKNKNIIGLFLNYLKQNIQNCPFFRVIKNNSIAQHPPKHVPPIPFKEELW